MTNLSGDSYICVTRPTRFGEIWVCRPLCSHLPIHPTSFFSFIPEFISRLPSITTLSPLTIPDLRRILTDVRGSLISQYAALFGYSGVEIRFTSNALNEICRKAAERGGGARGLRGIMVRLVCSVYIGVLYHVQESLLLQPMYETPGSVSSQRPSRATTL